MEVSPSEEENTVEIKKTVLVCLGERKREVTFLSEASDSPANPDGKRCLKETCAVYSDILSEDDKEYLVLQHKSEHWNGEFVDVTNSASILDKSVLKAVVDRAPKQLRDQVSA